jgi:uncharacterized protein (TIGR03435 family)
LHFRVIALIKWAFDIRSDRLMEKPKGWDSIPYDIVAVSPQETLVPGRLNKMMQSLLVQGSR